MKPDFTPYDFVKKIQKRNHNDKERLYSEALQLKQNLK